MTGSHSPVPLFAVAALFMEAVIAGMHYTAMAAATFVPTGHRMAVEGSEVVATEGLVATVAIGTLIILGVALVAAMIDRQVRAHRATTKAVELNAEYFRALIENSSDVVAIVDAKGIIRYASPSVQRVLGYTPDELVDMPLLALLRPEDVPDGWASIKQRRADSANAEAAVYYVRHRDGSWRVMETVGTNRLDDAVVAGIVVNARDVTLRKAAEDALRDSQRSLATLMSNLPGVVYRCRNEPAWPLEFVSQGAVKLFGISPADLVSGRVEFATLIHPDDQGPVWEQVQAALAAQRPFRLEYRIRPADGRERWVWEQGQGIYSASGELLALEGFVTDATERRAAEESNRLLASIVQSSDDAIASKDLDGRILSWNPGAERIYGYQASEVIGRSAEILLAPERLDEEQRILSRIRRGEQVNRLETVRIRKDGHRIDVSLTVSPLVDEHGRPIAAAVIARDITTQKRAAAELVRAKELAEGANRAKSDFLASMSHELRTPLNSVIGFANILRKNRAGTLGPLELAHVERIAANGMHLFGLINQILDLSKIEAGRMELEIAPIALDQLVRETLTEVQGMARPGVEVTAHFPPALAPLQTDRGRLKQVLINLVANALKFTERGSVAVHVAGDPETACPVRIDVVDTGIGIPPRSSRHHLSPVRAGGERHRATVRGHGAGIGDLALALRADGLPPGGGERPRDRLHVPHPAHAGGIRERRPRRKVRRPCRIPFTGASPRTIGHTRVVRGSAQRRPPVTDRGASSFPVLRYCRRARPHTA